MTLLLRLGVCLLTAAVCQLTAASPCHPDCRCEVESFGLFDSFSLTRVDCRGLGPGVPMPVPIPLDTTHLDLSSNAMGRLNDTMLGGPGYTTLVSLDLSSNHMTTVSARARARAGAASLSTKFVRSHRLWDERGLRNRFMYLRTRRSKVTHNT